MDAAAKAHAEAAQALQVLQSQRIRLAARLEAAAEEEARLARQRQTQAADAERFEAEAAGLRHTVAQARERRDTAEARRAEAEAARARLGEALEQARNGARDARSKHDALRAEKALLEGLAASADALPDSVRHLRADAARRAGLLPLSDVFATDEAHAVALESALGDAVNWLVAPTLAEAEAAFSLLRKDGKGKATILPLDRLPAADGADPRSLAHVVRCAPEHEPLKLLLLGPIWSAETPESAAALAKEHRITAVTPTGDVVEHGYKFRSGSNHKHTGLRVGLKDKLAKLTAAAEQTEADWKRAEADVERLSAELRAVDLTAAQQAARAAEQQLREVENQANALQARKGVYDKTAAETEERLGKAKTQQAELRALREQLEPEAEDLQDALDLAIRRQVEGRAEAERADENRQRTQGAFNDAQMAAQQAANRLENAVKDKERAETAMAGIRKRLDVRAENAKTSRDRILESKTEAARNREALVGLRAAKEAADLAFREADETAEKHRGRLRQTDTDLRELRRKKDVHLELLHHLVMAKERFDLQAKAVADHIWEAYGLTMDRVEEAMPAETDPGTVRETISHLRERLKSIGEVNALAIEEYEQEQERLELMERQVADLVDAEAKLLQTIEEINGTAQELFMTTFEQVRTNFQRVFHTLFDEQDHCDLLLDADHEDPLERKIQIVANPRGKRPSNIEQLSGGEKTLTAIALLFAIYLVKPSPFCVLDEVDAPLDDANVDRFTSMIRTFSKDTQFIIITHNKKTMEKAEMMYGVTMPETGVSKLVAVKMD